LGANNSLPTSTVLNVHSAASITDTATFDLNNYNQQVGGLLRGSTSGPAVVTNSGVDEKTLTIHNSGNYTFDSAITGNLALVKSGAGTQTLSGTSTYTGNTTVTAGTLVINGNISTSTTTVQNGGTLAGSGTTGSVSIANGGTLAPGNSPGTLTVSGDLGLNDASILAFEFDPFNTAVGGNINDLVTGISNFTLDGLLNITATSGSFSGVTSGTWRLFEYSGTLTNNILTLNSMPSLASGYSWSLDTGTAGQVNLTVIPEPRAALLGGLGMLALLRRRRR
jgi:fibronectin-binding autotransporter adhesin